MPTRRCCCVTGCLVGEDNFDRTDSNPPSGRWSVEGGEWEIDGFELNSISDGPIITTYRPPSPVEPGERYNSRILVDLVTPPSGDTVFGIICAYRSSTDYDWIKLEYNGTTGELFPTFYKNVSTLVMDITTHPGNEVWFLSPDTKYQFTICASDIEWTISKDDIVWHNCEQVGLDTLPTSPLGPVGFLMGRFDNWQYYVHWQSNKLCDKCECFCLNPDDDTDYSCIPECLKLTLTSDTDDVNCCVDDLELTMYLSNPDVSIVFPIPGPVFNATSNRKRWYSDPFNCPTASSTYQWFVLTCDNDRPLALSLLTYPNLDPTDPSAEPLRCDARRMPDTVSCNPILLEYIDAVEDDVTTCDIIEGGIPVRTGTRPSTCEGCWETGTNPQPKWTVTITECTP